MRAVQVAEPYLGRELLRLRIREVVALIDLDGLGLAKLPLTRRGGSSSISA